MGRVGLGNRWLRVREGALSPWEQPFLALQADLTHPPDILHLWSRVWEGAKFRPEAALQAVRLSPLRAQSCPSRNLASREQGPPNGPPEETDPLMELWNADGGWGQGLPQSPLLA